MKLEVGKSYIDRDGDVWNVVEYDQNKIRYPFRATTKLTHSEWFTEDGRYYVTTDSGYDFVSEVKNEVATDPEKSTVMKLEVGKSYFDRDGNVWHVFGYDGDFLYNFNAKSDASPSTSEWFMDNGTYVINAVSPWDLVEEVKDGVMSTNESQKKKDTNEAKSSFEEISKLAESFMVGLLASGEYTRNFDYMASAAFLAAEAFINTRNALENQNDPTENV